MTGNKKPVIDWREADALIGRAAERGEAARRSQIARGTALTGRDLEIADEHGHSGRWDRAEKRLRLADPLP